MSEPKHSPLPWGIQQYRSCEGFSIWTKDRCIAERWYPTLTDEEAITVRANAELIVRAVNCHEELVAALRESLEFCRCRVHSKPSANVFNSCECCACSAYKASREALKKAGAL